MTPEVFHRIYANVPMMKRFVPLSFGTNGTTTLSDVYQRIKELEEQMRPFVIEQQNLLRIAEKGFNDLGIGSGQAGGTVLVEGEEVNVL